MVSRATSRFWKSVAIGWTLTGVSAFGEMAWAQTPSPAPSISAVRPGDAAGAGKANAAPTGGAASADVEAVRKLVQEGRKALAAGDKTKAAEIFKAAQSVIDSVADKGLFHKNKAARHKSRLSAKIKALASA